MGKRKSRRSRHHTSVLTALFAVAPAAFVLTNPVGGASPIGSLLSGGGSWQSIQNFGWGLAQNVMQNWVSILILLLVVFVAVKVIRRMGRSAHITRSLTV